MFTEHIKKEEWWIYMITQITIEAIAYSLIYSVFMLVLFKIQGTRKQLYNYPPAIKERALERGITTQEEMNAIAKKNKTIGLLALHSMCRMIS